MIRVEPAFAQIALSNFDGVDLCISSKLKDSTLVQLESVGVAKVLQSEKNAMEIMDAIDI
jgi:hypothetical protein